MSYSEDKTTQNEKKEKKETNPLGLSPNTYALGEASKWSIVSLAGITAGLSGVLLGVFRDGATNWRNREPILKWLEGIKNGFEKGIRSVLQIPDNQKSNIFKGAGAIVALSFGIAIIASHFVQLPALARGRIKAKHALDKYNMLLDENVEQERKLAECEGVSTTTQPTESPAGTVQNSDVPQKQFTAATVPPVSSHVGALQQEKDMPASVGARIS